MGDRKKRGSCFPRHRVIAVVEAGGGIWWKGGRRSLQLFWMGGGGRI